jgi:type IV pilus assembly protein PilO
MTKNIQNNLVILVILAAGLSFVYFKYVLTPLNAKYQKNLENLQSVEAKLADTKRKAMELPKLQLNMKNLENEVADLEQLLPREKEVPGLLRIVTKTAQKYQLKISNITPGAVSSQPNYNEIPFQMTIQGTYHALGYFLNEIGQEARILSVKNINYTGTPPSKENSNTISVNCTLIAYTFKG